MMTRIVLLLLLICGCGELEFIENEPPHNWGRITYIHPAHRGRKVWICKKCGIPMPEEEGLELFYQRNGDVVSVFCSEEHRGI
jgi:hypothetical protein